MTTNKDKDKEFRAWMDSLNKKLSSMLMGFTTEDLADQNYYDWWQAGMTIDEAISELAEEEGFSDLI